MMQLVGDKDNIWDLIVKEESFKDQTPAQLMKTDLISFEKQQLKQDAKFLDKIISFQNDGKMQVDISDPRDQ